MIEKCFDISTMKEGLEAEPQMTARSLSAIQRALESGLVGEALRCSEAAIAQSPGDRSLRVMRAHCLMTSSDWCSALEELTGLGTEQDDAPAIRYGMAYCQLELKRPAEALASLNQVASEARHSIAPFQFLLARTLHMLGKIPEALAALDLQLERSPADHKAAGYRAIVLADANRLAEALRIANQVLKQDSSNAAAHLGRALALLKTGKGQKANADLQAVIAQQPENGRAWSGLGFVAALDGEMTKAIEYLSKAADCMPQHLGTWHSLAWVQLLAHDLPGAKQSIDRAMVLDRTFAENHGTLAMISVLEGDEERAMKLLRRGLRLNPASPSSLLAKAALASRQDEPLLADELVAQLTEAVGAPESTTAKELISLFLPRASPAH